MERSARPDPALGLRATPGGAAAVDRALLLLCAFRPCDHALSLAELSRRTGLYKSTGQRLLASLEHARLVERIDDGRYALGQEIGRLHVIYRQSLSLDRLVLPVLRTLAERTGNTAAYHVRQGDMRVCLYRAEAPASRRRRITRLERLPLDRGVGGRILTAFDPELAGRATETEKRLYAQIRARGFHAAIGDRLSDRAGIAAPVFRHNGSLAASLTLVMPSHGFHEPYILEVLRLALHLTGQV